MLEPPHDDEQDGCEEQAGQPFPQRVGCEDVVQGGKRHRDAAHHADRTFDEQPTGARQEAAHDGVRDEADEVAEPQHAEGEEEHARPDRRQRDREHDRKEGGVAGRVHFEGDVGGDESEHRSGAVLHASDCAGEAAPNGDDRHHDGRGQKRKADAGLELGGQAPTEDEGREGGREDDLQGTHDEPGDQRGDEPARSELGRPHDAALRGSRSSSYAGSRRHRRAPADLHTSVRFEARTAVPLSGRRGTRPRVEPGRRRRVARACRRARSRARPSANLGLSSARVREAPLDLRSRRRRAASS